MKFDFYESGKIYGIRYQFETGEQIPPHAHVGEIADQAHNIIVLQGRVCLKMRGQIRELEAGDIFDFDNTVEHSIEALEPSVTLHLMLGGPPASLASLPEEQKHA